MSSKILLLPFPLLESRRVVLTSFVLPSLFSSTGDTSVIRDDTCGKTKDAGQVNIASELNAIESSTGVPSVSRVESSFALSALFLSVLLGPFPFLD